MNMGPPTGREWGGKEEKKMAQKRDRKPFLQNNSFQQKEVGKDGDGAAHPQSCVSPTAPRSGVAAQLPAVPPQLSTGRGWFSVSRCFCPPPPSLCALLALPGARAERLGEAGGREAVGGTGEGREDDAPGALGSSPARRSRGSTGGCLTPSAQVRQDPRHPRGGRGGRT